MRQNTLDECHAGRCIEPVHRDVRKQRRVAVRHRPVGMHCRAQPLQRRHGELGPFEAGDHAVDQCVEQVLLAREVVVDAHCLTAEALAQTARRQLRQPVLSDHRQGGIKDAIRRESLGHLTRAPSAARAAPPPPRLDGRRGRHFTL